MKKIIILVVVLVVVIGGGFWLFSGNENNTVRLFEDQEPPTLFGKDDYQIEERDDGIYIVVAKVGLTAKVPDGWSVEIEGDDFPEPEYWVNLYSLNKKIEHGLLLEGCKINLIVGIEEKNVQEINNEMDLLINGQIDQNAIKKNYEFQIIKINNRQSLKWTSPEQKLIGQSTGINLPLNDKILLSISASLPPRYKNQCQPIWQEFLDNLIIE